MSTIPLSPAARTPSKNVERLLSLQKSAKHLTGADILSFAAEASAMKRMAMNVPSDENREPNSHHVPKRLFDINLCSKSAVGSYSPEKTVAGADEALDADSSSEGSEDSESEEEDDAEPVEATAAKHFEQIISIVNHNAQKRQDKAVLRQQAARTMQAHSNTEPTVAAAVAASANDHLNDFGESDAQTYDAELHSTAADSSAEAASSSSTSHTSTSHGTSTGPAGIRELVVAHIMSVLNTGTYEEILSLHGIGQVRALRLLTVRNAGHVFTSLEDLADIGMNDKTIEKFLKSNAAALVL